MTAEVKQNTSKKRGKRIGPSNLEAKRAAALRQAASAAETERRATGITSTVSFIQLIKEAALTGTIPSNPQLIATIKSWRNSTALRAEGLSPTSQHLVQDLKILADLLADFLQKRNSDELLQRFLHHVHLASKLAGVDLVVAGWRARGKARRGRFGRSSGALQSGGRGKISLWKSQDNRQQVFLGGDHSRITGIDSQSPASATGATSTSDPTRKQQEKAAKDAKALLGIAQQLIVSTDFRDIIVKIQRIGKRVINLSKESDDDEACDGEEESIDKRGNVWEKEPAGFDRDLKKLERDEAETSANLFNFHGDNFNEDRTVESRNDRTVESTRDFNEDQVRTSHDDQVRTSHEDLYRTSNGESVENMARTGEDLPIPSMETARHLPIIEKSGQGTPPRHSESQQEKPQKFLSKDLKRRQILQDLRDLFSKLAGNRQFSRALRDFYAVLLKMRQGAASMVPTEAVTSVTEDLRYDANFRAAQDELLQLLERLSGSPGVSLTPLVDNLKKVRLESRTDYELRDFLGDWRAYLKRCTGPESRKYLDSEEYMRRGEFLLKRTEAYFSPTGQYRSHLDESFDAFNNYIDGLKSDKLTRDLGKHVNKLIREDLIGIGRGEPLSLRTMLTSSALLRPDLLNDLRYHFLPRILQSMKSVPLPRIEVVTGGTVLVLEDLIIPADALVPLQMEILTSSHVTMNPKSRLFRKSSTPVPSTARIEGVQGGVQLKLSSIAGQVRNVRFTMDRHEGWPKFSDQGLADLRISGKGLSILIDLATHPASEITGRSDLRGSVLPAALIAHHVRVNIDRLNLNLHDSLHDSMYRIFNPIVSSVVKRNMERAIRDQIISIVDSVDGLLDRLSQSVIN